MIARGRITIYTNMEGSDAYSVSLSSSYGIINLPTGGTIDTAKRTYNISNGANNISSDGQNIVTEHYPLTTTIQAFRGSSELLYSTITTKGAYTVALHPKGCEAQISNGVLSILAVTDPASADVILTVNCEGNAVFHKRYYITIVADGKDAYIIDLDNENDSVVCDYAGNLIDSDSLPISNISVYCGGNLDTGWIFNGAFTGCTGSIEDDAIKLTTITSDKATVVVTAKKVGLSDLKTTFTVSKIKGGADGTPATRLWLLPSAKVVKRSSSGANDPDTLRCLICKQVGNNPIKYFSSGFNNMRICYKIDGVVGVMEYYDLPIAHAEEYIELTLQSIDTEQDYDRERILVVKDGSDGSNGSDGGDGQVFAYKKSDTKPSTPTGTAKTPTGWQSNVTDENNGLKSIINQDQWIKNIDGSYNAPIVEGEQFVKNRIEIVTTKYTTVDITLNIIGSAQNKIAIGNLDSVITNSTTQFAYQISSSSRQCTVIIPSAGKHFIEVGYYRASAGINDLARYKVDSAPSPIGVWWSSSSILVSVTGLSDGVWSDPVPYKGTNVSYALESATTHITCNSLGSYSPSSFLVTLLGKYTDGTQMEVRAYLAVYGFDGIKWVRLVNPTIKNSCVNVQAFTFYKQYMVKAHYDPDPDFNSISFASYSVNVLEDIKNSSSGSMIRNCGEYNPNATYVYDKYFRDSVFVRENGISSVHQVNTFGTQLKGVHPIGSDQWMQGNRELFTAIDTALIDGADIAGFLFKDELMISRSGKIDDKDSTDTNNPQYIPNLSINGKTGLFKALNAEITGTINATSGKIGGWDINGSTLEYKKDISNDKNNPSYVTSNIGAGKMRIQDLFGYNYFYKDKANGIYVNIEESSDYPNVGFSENSTVKISGYDTIGDLQNNRGNALELHSQYGLALRVIKGGVKIDAASLPVRTSGYDQVGWDWSTGQLIRHG